MNTTINDDDDDYYNNSNIPRPSPEEWAMLQTRLRQDLERILHAQDSPRKTMIIIIVIVIVMIVIVITIMHIMIGYISCFRCLARKRAMEHHFAPLRRHRFFCTRLARNA